MMTHTVDLTAISAGLLIGRLVLGLGMAAHGAQKLFGWFGGYGLAGTAGFFEMLGFRPGRHFAAAAALTEVASGILVALGLLGPIGPALMVSVMVVAVMTVHWKNGFFAQSNGFELGLLYATGAVVLALSGPGLYSLDAVLGLERLWSREIAGVALTVGVLGGVANLLAHRPAAEAEHRTPPLTPQR
jgi:putative oxidoreductase